MAGLRHAFVLLAVAGMALAGTAEAASPTGVDARTAAQIAALQKIKESASPAERKLDSRLLVTLRGASAKALPQLRTGVKVARGATEVSIQARDAAALVPRLRKLGGNVRALARKEGLVRAALPMDALVRVAGLPGVRHVGIAAGAIHAGVGPIRPLESKRRRAARVRKQLRRALKATDQGSVVSEGDAAHAANTARAARNVSGVGVKLCAMSDGVDSLAVSQASGDLPPSVDVLPAQQGAGDEGTAMLEILHDVAPGADLGFATSSDNSEAIMAGNIRGLAAAGCDVIVDDILFFSESPFQDGPIARAVNQVTSQGVLYFSSAGNEGNVLDGTSGNYEGTFVPSTVQISKFRGFAHDFAPGAGVQAFEPFSDDPNSNASVPVTLFWADPEGAAGDDYDLYLLDDAGDVVNFSQDVQDGDDDPYEILGTPTFGAPGLRLAVVKFAGADRYFQLSALRGRFSDSADGLKAYVSPGITRGHSAAADAFSIAAAPADEPLPFDLETGDPPNPAGPFPNPFTAAQLPERFTSDGPRRMFFTPAGAPVGGASGVVRAKPDFTAADGVTTSVEGFDPFFGTSAAAPHAAAIAGLVLSGNPGITAAEVRDAFNATALDLVPPGPDNRTGRGILRADRVLAHTGATPQPFVRVAATSITPRGDGDAYFEPGEHGRVGLRASSVGDVTAGGVSVRVRTDDPRATVTPPSRAYGDLAPGAKKTMGFALALARNYPPGRPVHLDVRLTFAGSFSPITTQVTVPTGQPSATETTFAYDGPPVPIPDDSELGATVEIPVTGMQYASDLTFSIDGTDCSAADTSGIDHTFVQDLTGVLIAPDDSQAVVFSAGGGGGDDMCQVMFDDDAENPFADAESSDAPFTGSWRPDDALKPLVDAPVTGTWRFKVIDDAFADTGTVRAVSLHLKGFVGA
jgi:Subtilase family